jgi:hypothetical protein
MATSPSWVGWKTLQTRFDWVDAASEGWLRELHARPMGPDFVADRLERLGHKAPLEQNNVVQSLMLSGCVQIQNIS